MTYDAPSALPAAGRRVRKAVIPAAGPGARFLPATKAVVGVLRETPAGRGGEIQLTGALLTFLDWLRGYLADCPR